MKFNPDDVIRLAEANPGFGFNRFMAKLNHGKVSRGKSQVMRLFEFTKSKPESTFTQNCRTQVADGWSQWQSTRPSLVRCNLLQGWGRGGGGRKPKPDRKQERDEVRQALALIPTNSIGWTYQKPVRLNLKQGQVKPIISNSSIPMFYCVNTP